MTCPASSPTGLPGSDLGVDALWLSPIYPSPGLDVGYDVSDHTTVDPIFGGDAAFDRLVDEAHRRGIRVILDLVMNHTSDQHAWFQASRASRDGPYADWYLWMDPAGEDADGWPLPPNNWLSWFGGSAWQWDEPRQQFYMHTFLVEQPELNWRNPAVEAAQFAMVRGWLDRGVDGFRLDVFNAFLKHPELLANPEIEGATLWARQQHLYDRDQPDFPDLIGRFRAIVDERPGRMSVGELFASEAERAVVLTTERHMVFDWALLAAPWSAEAYGDAIWLRETMFGDERWLANVLSNHDQARQATRLADLGRDRRYRRGRPCSRGRPPDDPRHAVHVLRRGDRAARRRHPGRRDHRPARPAGARRPRLRVVEPRPVPLADAVDRRGGSRLHDRPAMAPLRGRCGRSQRRRPERATRIRCCRPTGA